MSELKEQLELRPCAHYGRPWRECFMTRKYECPYCHGSGERMEETPFGDYEDTGCPHCNGSGEVFALVTIDWQAGSASKKNNPLND